MPRNKFAAHFARFGDTLKEAAENVIDKIDDELDLPIVIDFVAIKKAGDDCYASARETSGLCKITIGKANEMVSFGRELQVTLDDVVGRAETYTKGGSIDASKFALIQDLVDGDKIKEATKLAKELSALSLDCVHKSKEMMSSMEQGIDALHVLHQPDAIEPFVENKLAAACKKGHKKDDPKLPDVQRSVRDLKALAEDIEDVNLFTVVERGSLAFQGLHRHGELSQDMFASIQNFAEDVETVSGSFRGFKPEDFKSFKTLGKIRDVASSIWRCLRLSNLINSFAEHVGELMQWMISLFEIASKKLGAIWGALANAKDLLAQCMESVMESIRLCDESNKKTVLLQNTSREICDHLRNVLKIGAHGPKRAMESLVELADGDEILLCIELGTNIDDMFSDCIHHIIGTIQKVERAISGMPDVLKTDIHDLAPISSGGDDNDDDDAIEFEDYDFQTSRSKEDGDCISVISPCAASSVTKQEGIQENIRALKAMTEDIESSSVLTLIQRSVDGFEGVHEAIGICNNLISNSRGYAGNCKASIESFNYGEWDLGVASKHILEVFAIRNAGVSMKLMAESILELIKANLILMKAVQSRIKGLDSSSSLSEGFGSLVNSLANDIDLGQGIKTFGKFIR